MIMTIIPRIQAMTCNPAGKRIFESMVKLGETLEEGRGANVPVMADIVQTPKQMHSR
jgi:hypothetical protein